MKEDTLTDRSQTPESKICSGQNLYGMSQSELENVAHECQAEPFHGRQIFHWLYGKREYDISQMSDISLDLRRKLQQKYVSRPLTVTQKQSSVDKTEKLLFSLDGDAHIETVLIPERNTNTICVSSQAGCPLACRFCATGTMDLKRNLTVGEIVGQALTMRDLHGDKAFSNIVFMGMGEPLLNYQNLIGALEILTSPTGLNVSAKRITVSTAGITPKIKRLAETGLRVNLALSLHAATQQKRLEIMPVAKTFPLDGLISEVKNYSLALNRRITFEYVLLDEFNDTPGDIRDLAKLAAGMDCKVNLLSYNPVPGLPFRRPAEEKVNWFARELSGKGILVTVRQSRGRDIDAACGQLAARQQSGQALKK